MNNAELDRHRPHDADLTATKAATATILKQKAKRSAARKSVKSAKQSPAVAAFMDAMEDAGLIPPDFIVNDDQIHRCGTKGKPHGQDGSYRFSLEPHPHGGFQNWRDGDEWINWRDGDEALSPEILAAFSAIREENVKAEAAERQQRHKEAASNAATAWNESPPAPADHPYLTRKKIQPHGARLRADGHLLLPLIDMDDKQIKSLHSISPDGDKRFLTGGEKKGNCSSIGKVTTETKTVVICEGFATGASIYEATGFPVIVAYDCGNLLPVAIKARKHLPNHRIILAADNDHETDGNPGMTKATEAAVAINGALAVPWSSGNAPAGQTDFNDLMMVEGMAAVQEAFKAAGYVGGQNSPIEAALAALPTDPGAVYQPKVLSLLRAVRMTDPAEWARIREKVKASGKVLMADFDKATDPAKEQSAEAGTLPSDDPWPDAVDGGELLDELATTIHRFVIADDESIQAAALWTLATYFVVVAKYYPILNVTAPEKRCGKTTLLEVISHLALRAMKTSNIATAALFRSIEKWRPTLLIDEVDAFLKQNEEARGILNTGVQPGGCVIRCVGDDHEPTSFDVSGFKALSGIGALADTLHDRSIPVRLRRKFPLEKVENIRHAKPEEFTVLRRKAVRFAEDNAARFATIRPVKIEALHDRANDCWEPLLQVAELAGLGWQMKAMSAAISLMSVEAETEGTNIELLAAVRRAFAVNEVDKISLAALTKTLVWEEGGHWSTYNKGDKPIVERQVSKRLKGFVGGAQPVKTKGLVYKALGNPAKEVAKGYHLDKFKDAFDRYLPPVTEEELNEWQEVTSGLQEGFQSIPI